MSNLKHQKTLGSFGFKKIVKHNEEDVAVNIPNEVENEKVRKSFVCPYCNDTFVNNQGLGVHKLACEKNKVSTPVNKSTSIYRVLKLFSH